jgi:hypothetical protein
MPTNRNLQPECTLACRSNLHTGKVYRYWTSPKTDCGRLDGASASSLVLKERLLVSRFLINDAACQLHPGSDAPPE